MWTRKNFPFQLTSTENKKDAKREKFVSTKFEVKVEKIRDEKCFKIRLSGDVGITNSPFYFAFRICEGKKGLIMEAIFYGTS